MQKGAKIQFGLLFLPGDLLDPSKSLSGPRSCIGKTEPNKLCSFFILLASQSQAGKHCLGQTTCSKFSVFCWLAFGAVRVGARTTKNLFDFTKENGKCEAGAPFGLGQRARVTPCGADVVPFHSAYLGFDSSLVWF